MNEAIFAIAELNSCQGRPKIKKKKGEMTRPISTNTSDLSCLGSNLRFEQYHSFSDNRDQR